MSMAGWLMQQLSLFGEAASVPATSDQAPQMPQAPDTGHAPKPKQPPRSRAPRSAQTPASEALADGRLGLDVIKTSNQVGEFPHSVATNKVANRLSAPFQHPRANRQAWLEGQAVAYLFRRGKRRTIGFSVGADGLTVSAPRWVLVTDVEAALREKSAWIVRKLHEMAQREARMAQTRIEWRDGTTLPFLGENIVVVIDPRVSGAQLQINDGPQADAVAQHLLRVGLVHNASPEQLRDAVQAWLMRQAKRVFAERIAHFAPQLGVRCTQLKLSSAGTRWGSAHSDGSIRLNWRLIHFRLATIDYVVVHELSHLREMNHSLRFWQTVESVMPDYAQRKGELKDEAIPLWE